MQVLTLFDKIENYDTCFFKIDYVKQDVQALEKHFFYLKEHYFYLKEHYFYLKEWAETSLYSKTYSLSWSSISVQNVLIWENIMVRFTSYYSYLSIVHNSSSLFVITIINIDHTISFQSVKWIGFLLNELDDGSFHLGYPATLEIKIGRSLHRLAKKIMSWHS